jgi:hypothetical protein
LIAAFEIKTINNFKTNYMANIKTIIDEWSVKDLEDGSSLNISVIACTELGNESKPGIQVFFMGRTVNYEPLITERWAYKASKANLTQYLLEDESWMHYDDQYVKNSLVIGSPLKIKVEVKTRSSKPVIKEYELPFEL